MKCEFCNSEMKEGEIVCGVCGFTHVNFTEVDDRGVKAQMKKSFSEHKLGGITIEIRMYAYVIKNGNVTENESFVKIADATELVLHKIKWLDTEFYGISDKCTLELEVCVKKADSARNFVLHIDISAAAENLKTGLFLDDGLTFRLAVGNENEYVLSEKISLV